MTSIEDVTDEHFSQVMEINLAGVFR